MSGDLRDRIELWWLRLKLRQYAREGYICHATSSEGYWCTRQDGPHIEHQAVVDGCRILATWLDERDRT